MIFGAGFCQKIMCNLKTFYCNIKSSPGPVLIIAVSQFSNEGPNKFVRAKLWPWEPEKRPKVGIFRIRAWFLMPVFARKSCVTWKLFIVESKLAPVLKIAVSQLSNNVRCALFVIIICIGKVFTVAPSNGLFLKHSTLVSQPPFAFILLFSSYSFFPSSSHTHTYVHPHTTGT